MQQRSQAARAHCDTNYVLTEHNSITTSACRLCMFNQPLPWLAQHSGYCSTGCVGVCPQSAAPDLGSAAAKDTLLISMFQRIHGHCLALLCAEQCEWCGLSLHTTDMNSKIVFLAYFLAPLWLKLTHPVGQVVGLLWGRGLVLGRTPETQKRETHSLIHLICTRIWKMVEAVHPQVKLILTLHSVCCHGVCGTSLWLFQQ